MPTYEYRCPKGHEFELIRKMTDPPRARCPKCGLVAERQISGGAGLIFKGSGFYITDYGKDGKGPRQDKETEAKSDPAPAKKEEAAPKTEKTEKTEKPEKSDSGDKAEKPSRKKPKS